MIDKIMTIPLLIGVLYFLFFTYRNLRVDLFKEKVSQIRCSLFLIAADNSEFFFHDNSYYRYFENLLNTALNDKKFLVNSIKWNKIDELDFDRKIQLEKINSMESREKIDNLITSFQFHYNLFFLTQTFWKLVLYSFYTIIYLIYFMIEKLLLKKTIKLTLAYIVEYLKPHSTKDMLIIEDLAFILCLAVFFIPILRFDTSINSSSLTPDKYIIQKGETYYHINPNDNLGLPDQKELLKFLTEYFNNNINTGTLDLGTKLINPVEVEINEYKMVEGWIPNISLVAWVKDTSLEQQGDKITKEIVNIAHKWLVEQKLNPRMSILECSIMHRETGDNGDVMVTEFGMSRYNFNTDTIEWCVDIVPNILLKPKITP